MRTDAVYISLLPDDVTEEKLQEYFGSIGVIKVSWTIICFQHTFCFLID